MDNIEIKMLLKTHRVRNNITNLEISRNTPLSSASVSRIESKFHNNSVVEYLKYLRLKGVDLNDIFDEINR